MAVTLKDVALRAGVSIKTVSEVVNKSTRASEATRVRVEAIIAELGYQPNLSARRLKSGKTGMIGLVIPELGVSGHFSELASAIVETAERHKLSVLIEQTGGAREQELATLRAPWKSVVDGILINPLNLDADDLVRAAPKLPTVVLGEKRLPGPFDHVTIDNRGAAGQLANHLVARGRKRPLVIGPESEANDSGRERLAGFSTAMSAAGYRIDPGNIVPTHEWNREAGLTAIQTALDSAVQFDSVFAMNDALALGAIRGLVDAGLRVPEDVAVVGFDNIVESEYSVPRLTTIDLDRHAIAERAIAYLIERIGSPEPPEPRYDECRFMLIERESTL